MQSSIFCHLSGLDFNIPFGFHALVTLFFGQNSQDYQNIFSCSVPVVFYISIYIVLVWRTKL